MNNFLYNIYYDEFMKENNKEDNKIDWNKWNYLNRQCENYYRFIKNIK